MSQDLHASMIPGPPREPERGGDTAMTEEVRRLRRDYGKCRGEIRRLKGGEEKLRKEQEKLKGKCRRKDDRIAKLEDGIAGMSGAWQEMEAQARKVRAMEEELRQIKELLGARTAELSGAQAFLSTADRLSEIEVLGIVHNLNENIFQLAVGLTDAWERLGPSQATGPIEVDLTSQPRDPVLVQLARKRDLAGLTYLLQSFLCHQAVDMTSSWVCNQEFGGLGSVYQRISASGEHHIIDTE